MIKEILEREFMLKSARTLERSIGEMIERITKENSAVVIEVLNAEKVEIADLQAAREELQKAIAEEEKIVSGGADETAYIPYNPIMSLAQTALQQYCERKKPDEIVQKSEEIKAASDSGKIAVADKQLAPELAGFLSGTSADKLWDDYELADIGWANCVLSIGIRSWRKRYAFNPTPATPYKIENNSRVVLFSDWGSGLPRAQKVSEQIRNQLTDSQAAHRQKHLIHLGDVYYSGWAQEYEKNVLPFWSVKEYEADLISSWCLNENHDMYSGGAGFFDYLLADRRFKHQERSSFFSLENDRWLMLGLDTGYHQDFFDPHDLYGDQNTWAYDKLKDAPEKTGILLSHHQPFSAYAEGGEKILDKLRRPLDEKLVHTWFWGHEHRCTFYEERENIKYPRCIGHGGIPFYKEKGALPAGVSYEYRDGFDDYLETWNYFGFVVLDFDDDVITARYINERGDEHKTETIAAKK